MGITDTAILTALPAISDGLIPDEHVAALSFLEDHVDLFSTGTHDFEILKGTQHRLDLKDSRLF